MHNRVYLLIVLFLGVSSLVVAQLGGGLGGGAATPAGPTLQPEAFLEHTGGEPGGTVRVLVKTQLNKPWHINAHEPLDEFLIPTVLEIPEKSGIRAQQVLYPEAHTVELSFSPDPLAVYEGEFLIGVVLTLGDELDPGTYNLKGKLKYQACNDTLCMPPAEVEVPIKVRIASTGQPVVEEHAEAFAAFDWGVPTAVTDPVPEPEPDKDESPVNTTAPTTDWQAQADAFTQVGKATGYIPAEDLLAFLDETESGAAARSDKSDLGFFWILMAVIFGGLALNLTPCVLPLIPINVAIIGAGAKAGSKARGFALGLAYGLGIAGIYGGLGLAVVLGLSSAFGTINSSPWFNIAITILFLFLGLAMFDVVRVDFSKYQAKFNLRNNEGGSFLIAFVMGCVSAALAGACVAPVVIFTIVTAQDWYSQGYALAAALPFLLGAGMALPWPFLGMGLSLLPKPGAWMNRVKYAFGVFIIGLAFYYGHISWTLLQPVPEVDLSEDGWYTDLGAGLADAVAQDKPVFLDFTAGWCKNCKVMDATTFQDPAVKARFENYVTIKYNASDFADPTTKAVMAKYGVIGLPTYVVLQRK